MPLTPILTWSEIASQYDTFLVDLVGVIHNDIDVFPEAIRALRNLSSDQEIIFVSNNPRPSSISVPKLKSYGIDFPIEIVTSGDYARYQLQQDAETRYYHWGAQRNTDILNGMATLTTPDIENADKVLLTAFIEETDDQAQFDPLIELIANRKLPVFCANPDKYALYGEKSLRLCAGFFAEKLVQAGVNVEIWGKPELAFYNYVVNTFPHSIKNKKKCLMIGDTLETDIKGANQFGIDSLFISTGVSGRVESVESLTQKLQTTLTKPTYILPKLSETL